MAKKKVLVLAGAGFIGSNILEELLKNNQVQISCPYHKKKPRVLSKKIKYFHLDLKNEKKLNKLIKKNDYVVMCGGKIFNVSNNLSKFELLNENTLIHLNVLKSVCQNNIKKYLWFSSCTGYPEIRGKLKEKFFFKNDPSFHAIPGWHSRYIEKIIEEYSKNYKTKFLSLRIPEIFGKYDNYNQKNCRTIPKMINKILSKKNFSFKLDLRSKKNYIYSSDLANLSLKIFFKNNNNNTSLNV